MYWIASVILGVAMALVIDWVPWPGKWLVIVFVAYYFAYMLLSTRLPVRRRPCMFCGSREAIPLGSDRTPPRRKWSPLPPRPLKFDWVCEEHFLNYIRLRQNLSDRGRPS